MKPQKAEFSGHDELREIYDLGFYVCLGFGTDYVCLGPGGGGTEKPPPEQRSQL